MRQSNLATYDHFVSEPTTAEFYELRAAIEGAEHSGSLMGPGRYFYWFLAHHVKAPEIMFADVLIDEAQTTYDTRFGTVFMVLAKSVIIANYSDAAEDESGDPAQLFGTADLAVYPRATAPVISLQWTGRDLRTKKNQYGTGQQPVQLEKGSISVKGHGWDIQLPGRSLKGADDYFYRLRVALGLE